MSSQNRREFLKTGSIVACSLLSLNASLSAKESELQLSQIIDTHTHFYDPTRPEGVPFPRKDDAVLYHKNMPSDFIRVAGPYGVTGTIVVEASPWLEDNQWLLDLADHHPVIQGVIGNLEIGVPEFKDQLARFAKHPLYKGLRIRPSSKLQIAEPAYVADLQRLADADLVLEMIGSAAGYSDLLEIVRKCPELRMVVEHLPCTFSKDQTKAADEHAAMKELGQVPHVFAKVSNVLKPRVPNLSTNVDDYRQELDDIWDIFGADRVIYGSNWPVSDHARPYGDIIGLMKKYMAGRGQEDADRYFWKNAQVVYRLKK